MKPSIRDEMTELAAWSGRAHCRNDPVPREFDTIRVNEVTLVTDAVDRARNICLSCPVMLKCLNHGIAFEKRDQIWGGLTDEERDAWAAREGLVPA